MRRELPNWITENNKKAPFTKNGLFAVKTLHSLADSIERITYQSSQKNRTDSVVMGKLLLLFVTLITISCLQKMFYLYAIAVIILFILAMFPATVLVILLKEALVVLLFTVLLLLPSVIINPLYLGNALRTLLKVTMSIICVSMLNHTTQWNQLTKAARRMHIPAVLVFILDMTIKFIVLMGKMLNQILTAYQLRAVGKSEHPIKDVGGILGNTFLYGIALNQEMMDAMKCRGFTGDYKEF